jgi:hypothetical protein
MKLALSLIVFLYHIVLLCCLAFNTASCLGSVSRGNNIAPPDPFRWVALRQHHQTTLWSGGGLWSMPPGVKSLLGPYMFQPFSNRGTKCALTSFFPSNFSLLSVAYIVSFLFFLAYVSQWAEGTTFHRPTCSGELLSLSTTRPPCDLEGASRLCPMVSKACLDSPWGGRGFFCALAGCCISSGMIRA